MPLSRSKPQKLSKVTKENENLKANKKKTSEIKEILLNIKDCKTVKNSKEDKTRNGMTRREMD